MVCGGSVRLGIYRSIGWFMMSQMRKFREEGRECNHLKICSILEPNFLNCENNYTTVVFSVMAVLSPFCGNFHLACAEGFGK